MRSDRGVLRSSLFRTVVVAVMSAALVLLAPPSRVAAQARDSVSQGGSHGGPHRMGWSRETFLLTEVLEYDAAGAGRPVLFDVLAWTGGASRRLWIKADGGAATSERATHGEYQLLYGRLLTPWWDVQLGARADLRTASGANASRAGAVIGLQGLAPGWFELEPSLFVTTEGNLSFDLTASYDLFLTQRLVLQPRLESTAALRDDDAFGIGRGLNSTSFGARTRYEIRREFAPYMGVVWERSYGRAAELARLAGESAGETRIVVGLRYWR
jgi:copper resistance protein B